MAAGVVLAGRLYKCLAFKENKVYFIATATAAAGDQLDAEGFPAACTAPGSMPKLTPGTFVGLEPAQARDVLAAVRTIPCKPSSGKLHARMELLLSQTVPIPHVLSANIRYTDDLYGRWGVGLRQPAAHCLSSAVTHLVHRGARVLVGRQACAVGTPGDI